MLLLFGDVRLDGPAGCTAIPWSKGRALLAYVALAGRAVRRDTVAELLWTGQGRRNLRQLLYKLRSLPGATEWLMVDDETLSVSLPNDASGLLVGDLPDALPLSPPMADLNDVGTPAFADWLEQVREQLTVAVVAARLAIAERALETDPRHALQALDLSTNPLNLSAVKLAIRARIDLGERAEARSLWERVAHQLDALPPSERRQWSLLRTELTSTQTRPTASVVHRLRRLLRMDDDDLPPTVVARVLDLDLLQVAAAYDALDLPETDIPDIGDAAIRARLAEVLQADGDIARAAVQFERVGERRRAYDLYLQAGLQRDDPSSLRRAAELAPTPSQANEAWTLLVSQYRLARDVPNGQQAANDFLRYAQREQRPSSLSRARLQVFGMAVVARDTTAMDDVVADLEQLVATSPDQQPILTLVMGLRCALSRDAQGGRYHLERTLEHTTGLERLQALVGLGACLGMLGHFDEAREAHLQALNLAREREARPMAIVCLMGLAVSAERAGDHRTARRHLEELRQLDVGSATVDVAMANLATLQMREGAYGPARRTIAEVLARTQDPFTRAILYRARGELERYLGRFPEAIDWGRRSAELFAELSLSRLEHVARYNVALAALHGGEGSLEDVEQAAERVSGEFIPMVRIEVALVHPDAAVVERAWQDVPANMTHRVDLLKLRFQAMTGQPIVDDDGIERLRERSGSDGLYSRILLAHLGHPDTVDDRDIGGVTDGLLASQAESFRQVVQRWTQDPIGDAVAL